MKRIRIYPFVLIATFFILNGCKDTVPDKKPDPYKVVYLAELTTLKISSIAETTASGGGKITSDGGSKISEKGVCWNTSTLPTINNNKTTDGSDSGGFVSAITGLTKNTTYYVRAYATNEAGTAYGNEISFTTTNLPTIALGETYQGGIIFYIDATGLHGLIAAPKDQGVLKWGCQGSSVLGTSTALGKGDQNTFMIVNQCSTANIAAKICYDLDLNGYKDWYLPSKDELKLLHQNLYLKNIGNLKLDRYWSSSQASTQNAWCQFFNLALNQISYDKDLIAYSVRAVRSF